MSTKNKGPVVAMLSASLSLIASPAMAGTQTGYITFLQVRDTDGLVYFGLTGTATGKPACAFHSPWSITNENSDTGKRLFALLMSAHAAGQQVSVTGKNTCTRWADQEDVATVSL